MFFIYYNVWLFIFYKILIYFFYVGERKKYVVGKIVVNVKESWFLRLFIRLISGYGVRRDL